MSEGTYACPICGKAEPHRHDVGSSAQTAPTPLPCPFCGSPAEAMARGSFWIVRCPGCFVEAGWVGDRAEAIAAWNHRTQPPPPATPLDALGERAAVVRWLKDEADVTSGNVRITNEYAAERIAAGDHLSTPTEKPPGERVEVSRAGGARPVIETNGGGRDGVRAPHATGSAAGEDHDEARMLPIGSVGAPQPAEPLGPLSTARDLQPNSDSKGKG